MARDHPTTAAAARLILLWTRATCARDPFETLRLALEGGVDAVQIREKDSTAREIYALGLDAMRAVKRAGPLWIVNDRLDVALALGADGVQLGQSDLPLADARRLAPPPFLIGVSTHSFEQARAAADGGANFVGYGPMYASLTKPAEPAIGPEGLARVERELPIPVFAIGGLDAERIARIGARRAAVSSAILGAEDPRAAAGAVKAALLRNAGLP
jgi:thiamine-phosphate pyrophosphorylase